MVAVAYDICEGSYQMSKGLAVDRFKYSWIGDIKVIWWYMREKQVVESHKFAYAS